MTVCNSIITDHKGNKMEKRKVMMMIIIMMRRRKMKQLKIHIMNRRIGQVASRQNCQQVNHNQQHPSSQNLIQAPQTICIHLLSVQSSNKVTFSSSSSKRADFDDDIDITFEEERFDSGELVTDFIKQTSEHTAESIKRIASTLKEEETSSSGTIVFQNSDADLTDGETLTIPSLSERLEQNRTSPSQRPRNIPPKYADIQANLNLSDSSVEEINVTSKKDEFVRENCCL